MPASGGDHFRGNAMRVFVSALAPNPRRVRMFLAEKSVEIPLVQINTREREQFRESFIAVNPQSMLPVLELDDGVLTTPSLSVHGPWLRAVVSGQVDIVAPKHPMESVIGLFFFRNLDSILSKLPILNRVLLGKDENLINAYFALSGPFGRPDARFIPVKTLASGPASFVLEGFPAFVRGSLNRLLSVLAPGVATSEDTPEPRELLGS